MKVMIEIDLPEGQKIPTSEDILRLTSPDWIASWWHIDYVLGQSHGWDDDAIPKVSDYFVWILHAGRFAGKW